MDFYGNRQPLKRENCKGLLIILAPIVDNKIIDHFNVNGGNYCNFLKDVHGIDHN